MLTCSKCSGRGTVECPICKGIGRINSFAASRIVVTNCSCCDGHREINCPECEGLGEIFRPRQHATFSQVKSL